MTPAMRLGHSPPYTDPADVRFRVATVKTGCWLTFAICAAIVLYLTQFDLDCVLVLAEALGSSAA